MSKYFRPWNIDQTLLLPPNVQDFVPKGVSRFIVELVRESLDLKEIAYLVDSNPVTVRTRLFYARREFYRILAGNPPSDPAEPHDPVLRPYRARGRR